jgi:hypothetical protein
VALERPQPLGERSGPLALRDIVRPDERHRRPILKRCRPRLFRGSSDDPRLHRQD